MQKGFTKYSSSVPPAELVEFLNDMYQRFDDISAVEGIFKVEIIGDAYFGVAGCPTPHQQHAEKCARGALAMIDAVESMKIDTPALAAANVQIRIGVHSGAVVAGVVGMKDPRYHLFGDTVTYANLMESEGIPGKVQCSDRTAQELQDICTREHCTLESTRGFKLIPRGEIDIKGVGRRSTWFIERVLSGKIIGGSYIAESEKLPVTSSKFSRAKSSNSVALAAWDEEEDVDVEAIHVPAVDF